MRLSSGILSVTIMFLAGCAVSGPSTPSHGTSGLHVQVIELKQFEDGGIGGTFTVFNTLPDQNGASPFRITNRILESAFVSDHGVAYRLAVLDTPESKEFRFASRIDFKVYPLAGKEQRQFPLFGGKFVALHDDSGQMPDNGTRLTVVSRDKDFHIDGHVTLKRIQR